MGGVYCSRHIHTFLFFLLPFCVSAQKFQIVGEVRDAKDNTPLSFANVILYSDENRNKPLLGTYTQENGKFVLDNLSKGKYLLKIQLVGYFSVELDLLLKSGKRIINLPKILLKENVEQLQEIIIKGDKKVVKNYFEKEIINVSKDNRVSTSNLTKILENSSSITIDPLKGLSINGDKNVKILINGVWRGQDSGIDALDRLNPMNVERIEIISNPASRYGGEGTAGIINIIMKKNESYKHYIALNTKVATLPNQGVNISLGTFKNKLGFHGTYSYDYFRLDKTTNTNTEDFIADVLTIQKNDIEQKKYSHQALFGLFYAPNNRTKFNAQLEYSNSDLNNIQSIDFSHINTSQTIEEHWDTKGGYKVETINYFLDLSIKTKKEAHYNLTFNYLKGIFDRDYYIRVVNQLNNTSAKGNDDRNNGQITFLYKSQKVGKFRYELGGSYNFRLLDYAFEANNLDEVGIDISNIQWKYDEKISAVFLDMYYRNKNWIVRAGGRIENTDIKANNVVSNQSYLEFFPNVQIDYKFKRNRKLIFGFSRRINRPRAHQLNITPSITDPNNIRQGNPNLLPEFSYNLNLKFIGKIGKTSIIIIPYYKHIRDAVQLIANVDGEVTTTNYQNVDFVEHFGSSLRLRYHPLKQWTSSLTISPFYSKISDQSIRNEGFNYSVRWNNKMKIFSSWTFGSYYSYYSEQNILQGIVKPIQVFNISINKSFLEKKLSLSLEIDDVFNTKEIGIEANGDNFNRNILRDSKSSYFVFGLVYKPKIASKKMKKLSKSKIYSKEEIE